MKEVKVLMVERNAIIRNGIRSLLAGEKGYKIQETDSADGALGLVSKGKYDVVLIGSSLSHDHDFVTEVNEANENTKILIISSRVDERTITSAISAGALGFVSDNLTKDEMVEAIHSMAENRAYFTHDVARQISQGYFNKVKNPESAEITDGASLITSREREILGLIAEGNSSSEIAEILYISSRTVENHRANIMQKCRVKNAAHLVNFAYQQGILSVETK